MVLRASHLGHVHVRGRQGLVQGRPRHHEVHPDKERQEEVPVHVRNSGRPQTPPGNSSSKRYEVFKLNKFLFKYFNEDLCKDKFIITLVL